MISIRLVMSISIRVLLSIMICIFSTLPGEAQLSSRNPPEYVSFKFDSADGQALGWGAGDWRLSFGRGGVETVPFVLTRMGDRFARAKGVFELSTCGMAVVESSFEESPFGPGQKWKADRCEKKGGSLFMTSRGRTISSEPALELYNIVIVVTDDQRFDTMDAMPITTETYKERSMVFDRAYVTVPLCCPWRASFLSGGFHAHETGVLANQYPLGSALQFSDDKTLPLDLYKFGYTTGLIGKYMNGYSLLAPVVPPGWDLFAANVGGAGYPKDSWFDFYLVVGSSTHQPGSGEAEHVQEYTTDSLWRRASDFIATNGDYPFFLYLSTRAPHSPATAPKRDQDSFPGYRYEGRGFGEENLSDKPRWVRSLAREFWRGKDRRLEWARRRLQSLQPVDRMMGDLAKLLEEERIDDRTIVIFTSDNGELLGEHRLWGKVYLYEESVRVPLWVYFPKGVSGHEASLVANNLDIPATIYDLLALENGNSGASLLPIFRGEPMESWRDHLYLESFYEIDSPARHSTGIRVSNDSGEWKYIEHYTGERELYDLVRDPYELNSIHDKPRSKPLVDRFSKILGVTKALGLTVFEPPDGVVGRPYEFNLRATGGRPPYTFALAEMERPKRKPRPQKLPPGLELDPSSGRISGIPERSGTFRTVIGVFDSSISPQSGRPQHHYIRYRFKIEEDSGNDRDQPGAQ